MDANWKTGSRKNIMIEEILDIVRDVSKFKNHKIIIGSDSVRLGSDFVFTKAICILNKEAHDRRYFYYRDVLQDDNFSDLSTRLLKETEDSINLAFLLRDSIRNINIEIHADVNYDAKYTSSRYHNMIYGYVTGCGFEVKTKPDSFVASAIADLHTRKK